MHCNIDGSVLYIYCRYSLPISTKTEYIFKELEELKVMYENSILKAQLEMQEYTFQNISREIHDNIGQKLSLAKLYLNTISYSKVHEITQISDSVGIISEAINDLSNIARSMSSEIILNNGLIKGVEFEVTQLKKSGIYEIDLLITGNAIFLEFQKELVVFRIIQESLHNIIKHAEASKIEISLHYDDNKLHLVIKDNGKGFSVDDKKKGNGLLNMERRCSLLKGDFSITSDKGGTKLGIMVPIKLNENG